MLLELVGPGNLTMTGLGQCCCIAGGIEGSGHIDRYIAVGLLFKIVSPLLRWG